MLFKKQVIPKGWTIHKIGTLGETYNGLTGKNKTHFGSGESYIPYKNIYSNGKINIKNVNYVQITKDEKQNKVKYGDIFFTTSSETPEEVGMSSVLLNEVDTLYLNSFCFGYRLYSFKILLPAFARYLFRSNYTRRGISRLAQGSTRFNLTKRFLMELDLILPPINEQKKIAEILSKIDEDIEKTDSIIQKTNELKNSLMDDLFVNGLGHKKFKNSELGSIPESWDIKKLENICDFKTGKLNSNKAVKNGKYPFFTCSQETFSINSYSYDQEAILLAGNNAAGVYSVKYFVGKFDAYQRTYIITVKDKNELDYFYLRMILQSKLNDLKNQSFGSTTKFLTIKLLHNIKMKLPNITEQKEIAKILSSTENKIEVNKKIKEKLIELKKGLMQDLLSGKVRVK